MALDRARATPIPAKNRDRAAVPFGIVLAFGRTREDLHPAGKAPSARSGSPSGDLPEM